MDIDDVSWLSLGDFPRDIHHLKSLILLARPKRFELLTPRFVGGRTPSPPSCAQLIVSLIAAAQSDESTTLPKNNEGGQEPALRSVRDAPSSLLPALEVPHAAHQQERQPSCELEHA
jgi:hypothetical protein